MRNGAVRAIARADPDQDGEAGIDGGPGAESAGLTGAGGADLRTIAAPSRGRGVLGTLVDTSHATGAPRMSAGQTRPIGTGKSIPASGDGSRDLAGPTEGDPVDGSPQ